MTSKPTNADSMLRIGHRDCGTSGITDRRARDGLAIGARPTAAAAATFIVATQQVCAPAGPDVQNSFRFSAFFGTQLFGKTCTYDFLTAE